MVERFICKTNEINPGGDWVLYDDYQGLASLQEELMKYYENMNSENMNEIEALEAEVARLRKALEFYVEDDECKYGPSEGGQHPYCEDDEACRWCKGKQALEASDG